MAALLGWSSGVQMDESPQDRVPEAGQVVDGYRWDGAAWLPVPGVVVNGYEWHGSQWVPVAGREVDGYEWDGSQWVPVAGREVDGHEWDKSPVMPVEGHPGPEAATRLDESERVVPEVPPAGSARWSGGVGLLFRRVTAAVLVQAGVLNLFMPSGDLMGAWFWTPVAWGWLVPGAALDVIVNNVSLLVLRTGGLLGNLIVGAGLAGIGVWVWRGSRAAAVTGMVLIAFDTVLVGVYWAGYPLAGWGLGVVARLSALLLLGVAFRVARPSGGGGGMDKAAAGLAILATVGHLVATGGLVLMAAPVLTGPTGTPPQPTEWPDPASSCAVTATGGVKCWGLNHVGQLGDGTTTDRSTPVDVAELASRSTAVSVGGYHACAVTASGGVECWGLNIHGQLGDGTTTDRSTPVQVVGLTSGVIAVSAGREHTCAVMTTGGVTCWGSNSWGQLGDGTTTTHHSSPVAVAGLTSGVTTVSAGWSHTCALTTRGGVTCWGMNLDGQLGDGTTTNSSGPVAVAGLSVGVRAVSAGYFHTCALTTTGRLTCWGNNLFGELGKATTTHHSSTPVEVAGLSAVACASAGNSYTCAVTEEGDVWCWGRNEEGQLGRGPGSGILNTPNPVKVAGLTPGVAAVVAGNAHTCAVTAAGGVTCWGKNDRGQLGDGTTTDSSTPVHVIGF